MCAITDKSGVLGLGGIIGGTRSGTGLETKNVFHKRHSLLLCLFKMCNLRYNAVKQKMVGYLVK